MCNKQVFQVKNPDLKQNNKINPADVFASAGFLFGEMLVWDLGSHPFSKQTKKRHPIGCRFMVRWKGLEPLTP